MLKQVYKFFNYCNPLGLELAQGMPKFDAPVRSNNILLKRWQGLYGQASGDATVMFDYGDKMYGPQIYELGRALFLYKLHSPAPGPEDQEFSREQWNVLRAVFHIISNLNSPGGPNLSYAPDFAPNTRPRKRKATRWAEVERTLRDNLDGLGMGSGLISFLVGSPSAWTATSAKLGKKPSREAIIALAAHANSVLAKAAGASIRTSRTRRPRRQVRRAFSPISSTATLTPRFCRRPSASVFSVPPIRRANSRRSAWPGV
ncbi:MAG: hypothetical protein KKB20_21455 [Proteobacteria bacterium]|nr:hypothetical protein [Pseudomonadota bacterium]